MLDAGVTAIGLPVIAPGFHVYDTAPLPVKVELCPAHKLVEDAVAFTLGKALTVTETVFVFVQPVVVQQCFVRLQWQAFFAHLLRL